MKARDNLTASAFPPVPEVHDDDDDGDDGVWAGRQLTTFNRPSRVHVGAKRNSMDNIVRPFRGEITGQLSSSARE